MNSRTDPPRQRLLGLLGALWARRDEPTGPRPTDAELAALFDGALSPADAREVRRRLAQHPACYRSVAHLSEVADIIAPEPRRQSYRRRGLVSAVGGLGVAAAALLLSVTLRLDGDDDWTRTLDAPYEAIGAAVATGRYRPSQAGWVWRSGYGARALGSPDTPEAVAARTALTVGVHRGLERATAPLDGWLEIRSDLATAQVQCGDLPAADCKAITDLYEPVGRWAVLMHFACEPLHSGEPSGVGDGAWTTPGFWADAARTLERIATLSADATPPPNGYVRLFQNWQSRADAADPATLCRGIPPLLNTIGR